MNCEPLNLEGNSKKKIKHGAIYVLVENLIKTGFLLCIKRAMQQV